MFSIEFELYLIKNRDNINKINHNSKYRRAYGWQRNGGMAEYMLTKEKDLVTLPDELSYSDWAHVACGFGTGYEGLGKKGICGNDAVLVTCLGPVGLATTMLCKALGVQSVIGTEAIDERIKIAKDTGLFDIRRTEKSTGIFFIFKIY